MTEEKECGAHGGRSDERLGSQMVQKLKEKRPGVPLGGAPSSERSVREILELAQKESLPITEKGKGEKGHKNEMNRKGRDGGKDREKKRCYRALAWGGSKCQGGKRPGGSRREGWKRRVGDRQSKRGTQTKKKTKKTNKIVRQRGRAEKK